MTETYGYEDWDMVKALWAEVVDFDPYEPEWGVL